jgi:hypothetical protein
LSSLRDGLRADANRDCELSAQASRWIGRVAAPVARQPDTSGSDIVALHLDGRVIGSMVADQLARAASLPPSSATGFDRRLTPAWTGLAP